MNLNPRCIACGVEKIHVNECMCPPCLHAMETRNTPHFPYTETRINGVVRDMRLPETKLAVI